MNFDLYKENNKMNNMNNVLFAYVYSCFYIIIYFNIALRLIYILHSSL